MNSYRFIGEKLKKTLLIFGISFFALLNPATAQQWSEPVRISEPGGCLYPQILAQGDTLHVVFTHLGQRRGIGYLRSVNGGVSWASEVELSDILNTNSTEHPHIIWHNTEILVIWRARLSDSPYSENIYHALSTDNGISWLPNQRILNTDLDHIQTFTAAGADSLVSIFITARPRNPDTLVFYHIRSTDFGQSWSLPEEIMYAFESFWPDQATANGIIHYVWDGRFRLQDIVEVYYTRSTDCGLTWSDNVMLSSADTYLSEAPAVATDTLGNPAVSWWDFKYSPYQTTGDILARWSYDGGENWGFESQITTEHRANFSDIIWNDGTLRVVWMDWRFDQPTIYYSSASGSYDIWLPEQRLEDDPDWSSDPALVADDSTVFAIWYDEREDGGIYFTRFPDFPNAVVEDQRPNSFGYLSAYPNPFNSATTIMLTGAEQAEIGIYDITGRLITTLHTVGGQALWDASAYSSGLYFARLAGEKAGTIKLVLVK
jgi:hypothetical protein